MIAFLASAFCLLAYGVTQQTLRHLADDPQRQIAQDDAAALMAGSSPVAIVPSSTIDLRGSLAPFVIIFDQSGNPIVSSGKLDGATPAPPKGVFADAAQWGEDRVTWEPQSGVRIATIIVPYSSSAGSGYVLAGRSLNEIDEYENQAFSIAAAAWLCTVIGGAILSWILFGGKK